MNILPDNLKNALTGTYHAFKFTKYARRYLVGFQYRFNRRYKPAFYPAAAVIRAAAATKPWTERRLKAAELGT